MGETKQPFPANWQIAPDFDPNNHIMQLKGRDYLNVQARLLWFIRDQRALIVAGLANMSYVIQTDLVEMDREHGWAHFKTYVRDVLGNESTMYGSESAKDFGDFAEKASTKSLGRALLALGYGTAFAPEMDEGDRVVDSPVDRRATPAGRERLGATIREAPAPTMREPARPHVVPEARPTSAAGSPVAGSPVAGSPVAGSPVAGSPVAGSPVAGSPDGDGMATEKQMASIRKLCEALGKAQPDGAMSYARARELLSQLSGEYQRARRAS